LQFADVLCMVQKSARASSKTAHFVDGSKMTSSPCRQPPPRYQRVTSFFEFANARGSFANSGPAHRHWHLRNSTSPPIHTNLANLARSTIHTGAVHELTSKCKFAKRAICFANLPSLQTRRAVAPLLTLTTDQLNRLGQRLPASSRCPRRRRR